VLAMALLVATTLHPQAPDRQLPSTETDAMVGHYIVAVRAVRDEMRATGSWDWSEGPGVGCEVLGPHGQVIATSRTPETCVSVALHSRISVAALDSLLSALQSMDRGSVATLGAARSAAQSLIEPLFPSYWRAIRDPQLAGGAR